jgi:hypothetical protein
LKKGLFKYNTKRLEKSFLLDVAKGTGGRLFSLFLGLCQFGGNSLKNYPGKPLVLCQSLCGTGQ